MDDTPLFVVLTKFEEPIKSYFTPSIIIYLIFLYDNNTNKDEKECSILDESPPRHRKNRNIRTLDHFTDRVSSLFKCRKLINVVSTHFTFFDLPGGETTVCFSTSSLSVRPNGFLHDHPIRSDLGPNGLKIRSN